jgi:hypothetical protein
MVPFLVGFWIGGLICWIVIHRQATMPDEVRRLSYQTMAFILALLVLIFVAAAVVAAEPGAVIVAAAITFGIAILVVLRVGLPEQHPVWRRVSARLRD